MTREKYESLPLATLKELAKARKMKGVSTLKKADLIEAMISLDEQEDQEKLSEQKESSQEHLKEMQNQNREEKAASELKENKEHREAKDKKPETDHHIEMRLQDDPLAVLHPLRRRFANQDVVRLVLRGLKAERTGEIEHVATDCLLVVRGARDADDLHEMLPYERRLERRQVSVHRVIRF